MRVMSQGQSLIKILANAVIFISNAATSPFALKVAGLIRASLMGSIRSNA